MSDNKVNEAAGMHLHLDAVGGIAGDMFCASFVDAYPHLEEILLTKLSAVLPKQAGAPLFWSDKNKGIHVKRFALKDNNAEKQNINGLHDKDSKSESTKNSAEHGNIKTTFVYIKKLIENSVLSTVEQSVAVEILTILATAEAKVHATSISDVHFHELADWDSLMDIVAAAILISAINIKTVSVSSLPVGRGFVQTQHGLLPVPAPATAEILKGFEFRDDGIEGERVTPTGAAILRYLITTYRAKNITHFKPVNIGYGGGQKTFENLPNFLRLTFSHTENTLQTDTVGIIEFDVDDMTPEEMAISLDYIRDAQGVIDVTTVTARAKKNRLTEQIKVVFEPAHQSIIEKTCFEQTTTIGLRYYNLPRKTLKRSKEQYDINSTTIAAKRVVRPDGNSTIKVESDDLKKYSTLDRRRIIRHHVEIDPSLKDT